MTAAKQLDLPPVTFDEYVEFERNSNVRHEIQGGVLVAMAGGRIEHDDVGDNFRRKFGKAYEAGGCRPNSGDVMVYLAGHDKGAYPDATVTCGEREFREEKDPDERRVLLNPTLVVEVLSPSTAMYDMKDKLDGYLSIPSLRQVVLADPTTPWVRVITRTETGFSAVTVTDMAATVELESIRVSVSMAEIYFNVKTTPASRISQANASVVDLSGGEVAGL